MIKHLLCLCLAFVITSPVFAADPPDAKAIAGTWIPVKAELGGQPLPDAALKTISLKLADGKYDAMGGGKPDHGTYTLDATVSPKSMTVTGTNGPNQGKTFPCIYTLDGDTLRICYDLSGKKQPAEFKSEAGTQLYLVTYNRTK